MRWAVVLVACLAAACGGPEVAPPPPSGPTTTAPTVPPAVTEPMGVEPLVAVDPCALVDDGLRRELRVAVEGFGYTEDGARTCRWEETGQAGIGLGVRVEPGEDPLVEVYARGGMRISEVRGFPAAVVAADPEHVCDVFVKTAQAQGFSVIYGALDQRVDACGGAMRVAEHLADRVRAARR